MKDFRGRKYRIAKNGSRGNKSLKRACNFLLDIVKYNGENSYKKDFAEGKMRYILASKSPRRKELLSKLVDRFEIITAETDECLPKDMHPRIGVEILAVRKGAAVAEAEGKEVFVISSDTLVELSGEALGKPRDEADAYRILSTLSGKCHNVHTGVAIHYMGRVFSGVHTSRVYFKELSDKEIYDYIKTGEPMDKAGAYGIQGLGGRFVLKFEGEFDSIMGLSIELLSSLMAEAVASARAMAEGANE